MKQYAFGVDLGGTTVKMGLFTTSGGLVDTWEIPTRTENGGSLILGDIAASIKAKMAEKEIEADEVEGIGMGVPGPVDEAGNVLKCVNLGWGEFNVENYLGELTGCKVKAGNDANVAALGEMWQGGGKGFKDLVVVTLGTGIGGGIILNGRILTGANGAAGEIGHMTMNEAEEEVCGCGKKGCLEQYCSANGIARLGRRYIAAHPDEATALSSEPSSKDIWDEFKKDDAVAIKIVDQWAEILGKGLAYVACVINPEVFVIGGGMSKAGECVLDKISAAFKPYAFHASKETDFRLATLGNNAGIYGGVKLVLD